MPRFDNSIQYYHAVEVDRREAHKTSTLYWQFPLAWSFLLGIGFAIFGWRAAWVYHDPTPWNWAYAGSALIPDIFLIYYLAWWLRELMHLNREAKPPKEPPYTPPAPVRYENINTPITVKGYIQAKNGSLVPASEIRAGKRVKLGSYVDDGSDKWLTFLISQTSYNDADQTCALTIGPPPELNLPTFSFPDLIPPDQPPSASGGGRTYKKKPPKPKGKGWDWNAKAFKWVRTGW